MADEDREALRRRYGPEGDVGLRPDEPAAAPVTAARKRRRMPRNLAALIAAVLVVAAGAAVLVGVRTGSSGPAPVAPEPVVTAASTRQEFEDALAGGGAAGIAAYLVTHRSPAALRSVRDPVTTEDHGVGAGTLRIPPAKSAGGASVLLVLGSDASPRWTLRGARGVLAVRGGAQEAGVLTAATIRYTGGGAPTSLRIELPDGIAWGAAVVLSN